MMIDYLSLINNFHRVSLVKHVYEYIYWLLDKALRKRQITTYFIFDIGKNNPSCG